MAQRSRTMATMTPASIKTPNPLDQRPVNPNPSQSQSTTTKPRTTCNKKRMGAEAEGLKIENKRLPKDQKIPIQKTPIPKLLKKLSKRKDRSKKPGTAASDLMEGKKELNSGHPG